MQYVKLSQNRVPREYYFWAVREKVVSLQFNMDSSRFIICRASAGSGKTYTLVKQYLQLAFSANERELPSRFARILAITFTNKAANEMKERILRELDNMAAQGTGCPMGEDIGKAMKLNDGTLRHYAEIVRKSILHNYSDFAVCTIDSFVHRLVRTFAHDLGLPMNFDVYLDNTELIQSAVDNLMALAGTEGQEELTEMLCDFAESRMEDGKNYMVEQQLKELAKELFKENTPEYLKDLKSISTAEFRQIHKDLRAENLAWLEQMKAKGAEALKVMQEADVEVGDFFRGNTGAGAYFKKISEGRLDAPNSYAIAYLEGDKLGGSKTPKDKLATLESIKPRLQEIHLGIADLREPGEKKYYTRKLLMKNLYALALMNKMNELVAEFSHENEIVHLSEFNKQINAVVQDEPTPFIYERIGNRYYNYLIDEFQDTSRLQWQNLVPLIENGVGGGHTSLVVGDGKQAIYRFRQGDVEQFVDLPHVDNAVHGRLLEHPGTSIVDRLERNFRTAGTVVEFNNSFFDWAIRNRFGDNDELKQIYIGESETPDLAQIPMKDGGYVQVGFWNTKTEPERLWNEMLEDIRMLTEEKGYSLRDITILARNKNTLAEISTFLTAQGIDVVSSESFLLTQSLVVMMMRSLLQYLLDGNDRVAAQRVLLYLYRLGKVKQRYSEPFLKTHQDVDLDAILQNEGLTLNCQYLRHLGLYDCCEEALRALQLDGIESAYTATWLNVVAKYSSAHRQDLAEFLEWFDEKKDTLSTSTANDLDAIQLMTIHKAKGLESPVVMYPVMNRQDKTDGIWVHIDPEEGLPLPASMVTPKKDEHTIFDAEYEEEVRKSDMDNMNVLYVALTRPKEKLMLYCQEPPKTPGKQYTSLLNDFFATRDDAKEVRTNVVCLGENSPKKKKEAETNGIENVELKGVTFPSWSHRIAIAEQASKLFGEVDTTAATRGTQMHELLSMIGSIEDSHNAVEMYCKRNKLADNEKEELMAMLDGMLKQEQVSKFFAPEHACKNECSMVWQGEVLRPDRIVFTPTETWVVDFKTGAPKIEHHDQVMRYCDAIRAMGYPEVRGYLLYIGKDKCQVVHVE